MNGEFWTSWDHGILEDDKVTGCRFTGCSTPEYARSLRAWFCWRTQSQVFGYVLFGTVLPTVKISMTLFTIHLRDIRNTMVFCSDVEDDWYCSYVGYKPDAYTLTSAARTDRGDPLVFMRFIKSRAESGSTSKSWRVEFPRSQGDWASRVVLCLACAAETKSALRAYTILYTNHSDIDNKIARGLQWTHRLFSLFGPGQPELAPKVSLLRSSWIGSVSGSRSAAEWSTLKRPAAQASSRSSNIWFPDSSFPLFLSLTQHLHGSESISACSNLIYQRLWINRIALACHISSPKKTDDSVNTLVQPHASIRQAIISLSSKAAIVCNPHSLYTEEQASKYYHVLDAQRLARIEPLRLKLLYKRVAQV